MSDDSDDLSDMQYALELVWHLHNPCINPDDGTRNDARNSYLRFAKKELSKLSQPARDFIEDAIEDCERMYGSE